jgi:hypothetical protein
MRGWFYIKEHMLREELGGEFKFPSGSESLSDFNEIFLGHALELHAGTQKGINFLGGVTDELLQSFERLYNYNGTLWSLDVPIHQGYMERILKHVDYSPYWEEIANKINNIEFYRHPKKSALVIGDSHAGSVYTGNQNLMRRDKQTLHGVLNQGLANVMMDRYERVTTYFGNIDIRHHLCRFEDPVSELKKLVKRYEEQLIELQCDIEIVCPLPIENESRAIPKTGWYKGTPFYGSWKERNDLYQRMTHMLQNVALRNNFEVFVWPDHLKNEKDELDFKWMEKPRSVHLNLHAYRLYNKNIDQDCGLDF